MFSVNQVFYWLSSSVNFGSLLETKIKQSKTKPKKLWKFFFNTEISKENISYENVNMLKTVNLCTNIPKYTLHYITTR